MLRSYIMKNGKPLRCGYTTGACAAAAAGAATQMLLTGTIPATWALDTPKGVRLALDILEARAGEGFARCAVQKDSGDDPDVTNGVLVYATAKKTDVGIVIDGGEGVGHVTKPGLDQPVGAAAINSMPRRMIREQVEAACAACRYSGGVEIAISIPGGEELARRTFNPRLGIEGGLSVIGTTGIVEPMSTEAVVETIRLELGVLAASDTKGVVLCPGAYGESFAREALGLAAAKPVCVSNFIGEGIDLAASAGFGRILLVGHIGKLVKLGIGMMNTHSACGDGRMETLAACALEAGGEAPLLRQILACATTDAALDLLDDAGLLDDSMAALRARVQSALERRAPAGVRIGFVCFTNAGPRPGILFRSDNAQELMDSFAK